MIVTLDQLAVYGINDNYLFARRTDRDRYFIDHLSELVKGLYCAIGNNTDGWELEQYNGVNWVVATPDETYRLVITSNGLKVLANVATGEYRLTISGIKIIDQTVLSPSIPFVDWTDNILQQHGNVKFSIGTLNSHNPSNEQGESGLNKILSWKYNNASGGLQYCLNLPPEGLGSISDQDEEEWNIGTIGLYVKGLDGNSDVLFAVATLPSVVKKYANNIDKIGNRLKFYFNTVLSNLGFVSNLEVMEDGNQNLPEVPNETLLFYPTDNRRRPYNCYVVDNLFGTNVPALAIPRPSTNNGEDGYIDYVGDWAYFQPSTNFIYVGEENFSEEVSNYQFVYWEPEAVKVEGKWVGKYKLAEGKYFNDEVTANKKMPVGVRIGGNIVYSGEITNVERIYKYIVNIYNGGQSYAVYDQLNIFVEDNLIIKIEVTGVDGSGKITSIRPIGSCMGSVDLKGDAYEIKSAKYDPRSPFPRDGNNARFRITSERMNNFDWQFEPDDLNKPAYCDKGVNAGKPTTTVTDCFLGWITGANSIRLGLDLRNEATESVFGTTRYATNTEVCNVANNPTPAHGSAVTPQTLNDNYIQKSKPQSPTQPGYNWKNPIEVRTCIHFNEMILGRSIKPIPEDSTNYQQSAANWNDPNVDFWGRALRAEWADLAEYYESDDLYQPGTLITFGEGDKEITKAQFEANGVISTKPGLQLGSKKNDHYLPVALVGRVPVMMDGNSVNYFGDKIYLSRVKPGTASTIKNGKCIGKIIDKNPGTKRLVECVVRMDFGND